MSTSELISLVCAMVALITLLYTIKNSKKADIKDIQQRATENATVNVKLDNISGVVTDIKYDISSVKKEVATLNERVVAVESSVKSAHHRIDGLEKKG